MGAREIELVLVVTPLCDAPGFDSPGFQAPSLELLAFAGPDFRSAGFDPRSFGPPGLPASHDVLSREGVRDLAKVGGVRYPVTTQYR